MGVYYNPAVYLWCLAKDVQWRFIYAQRGAGVARFDERVYQNLTRWSEQRLRLHVFVIWSGI